MYDSLIEMPLRLQRQNIGAEVSRAVRFRQAGKEDRAVARAKTAIDMLKVLIDSDKEGRTKEYLFMAEELEDFINHHQSYDENDSLMLNQYEIFCD